MRIPSRAYGTLAVLVLVAVLLASGLSAVVAIGPVGSATGGSGAGSGAATATTPSTATVAGTLGLGQGLGNLTPEFWAVNYNYQSGGYANHSVAALLNATPISWLRLPLVDTSYSGSSTWKSLATFCGWVHCHSIATVGGPNTTAQQAANEVLKAESLGIHPDYWVFGNEPNLWPNETSLAYANEVYQWIQLVRATNASAKILGVEISGNPRFGSDYIYNVTKVDGPYIQGLAIQVYPQVGGSTLADFLGALTAPASVSKAIANARTLMAKACPTCAPIPLLLNEVNGGSGFNANYISYREQFPDATFLAASIVQGLRGGLVQFTPWTFTAASNLPANATNHCDFGMVQLLPGCDQEYLQPTYFLYRNLLPRLPYGPLTNLSLPGVPAFYGVQSQNGSDRALLLVNANGTNTDQIAVGSSFPTSGSFTSYEMDPNHVASPIVTAGTLGSSGATFALPPLGVMVVRFSPGSQAVLSADPPAISLGGTTLLSVSAVDTGAIDGYSYPALPPGCPSQNSSSIACTPTVQGTFPVSVRLALADGATLTAATNVTVSPILPSPYPVTFLEQGLANGTAWTVLLNGAPTNTTSSSLSYHLENGSYAFAIPPVGNLSAEPGSGNISVAGDTLIVAVAFSPAAPPSGGPSGPPASFNATFQTQGLGRGTSWTLTLDGTPEAVATANLTVELTVGDHPFGVNATGYAANPPEGAAASTGSPFHQQIDFTALTGPRAPADPLGIPAQLLGIPFPWLVGLMAALATVSGTVPRAARRARRARYHRWIADESRRAEATRAADVARELPSVTALLARAPHEHPPRR